VGGCDRRPVEQQGQGDVVEHRQARQQVEALVDHADGAAPGPGPPGAVAGDDRLAHQRHPAGGGREQPARQVDHAGLARARRAHQGDQLAGVDRQGQVVDHAHGPAAGGPVGHDVVEIEDG
jgi:hypothetical protein